MSYLIQWKDYIRSARWRRSHSPFLGSHCCTVVHGECQNSRIVQGAAQKVQLSTGGTRWTHYTFLGVECGPLYHTFTLSFLPSPPGPHRPYRLHCSCIGFTTLCKDEETDVFLLWIPVSQQKRTAATCWPDCTITEKLTLSWSFPFTLFFNLTIVE